MSRRVLLFVLLMAVLFAAPAAYAEEPAPTPRTTSDVAVTTDVLDLQLKPLRRDQLAVEAEAWADLLEKKVEEIGRTQIDRSKAEADEAKTTLDTKLGELQEEKAKLVTRLNTVLAAWTAKGGDASELKIYVDQVSGLDLNVTDWRSALAAVSNWATSEEGGIKLGKNILFFLLLLFLARVISNVAGKVTYRGLSAFNQTPQLLKNFLSRTVRNVIFAVGVVIAVSKLGVNVGPLLAAIGAAGLVIGLALQDVLSNFASGVMILLYRPYELGDVVNVAGVTGKVEAMSLVSTTIKTFDNQVLVVPNTSIWGAVITNVTGSDTRRVDMKFGIGYDDDVDTAKKILEDIVGENALVLKDPAPVVAIAELADSSVNFNVRPWANTDDYWTVYGEVTTEVKKRFDAEGISIPFPQQDVHFHGLPAPAAAPAAAHVLAGVPDSGKPDPAPATVPDVDPDDEPDA